MLDETRHTARTTRAAAGRGYRISRTRSLTQPGVELRTRLALRERLYALLRERRYSVRQGVYERSRSYTARMPRVSLARVLVALVVVLLVALGVSAGVIGYIRSKQMNVQIHNGTLALEAVSTARTVGELLAANDIRIGPFDEVTPSLNTRLSQGMAVYIDRAKVVFIQSGGQTTQVYMTTGTVKDALYKAEIAFDSDDEIEPVLEAKLVPGMRITHANVESKVITERHRTSYEIIYKEDSTLAKGKTVVSQSGKEGVRARQVRVTYRDGVEIQRVEVSDTLVSEPVNRIVLRGTYVEPPKPTPAPVKSSSSSDSKGSSSSDSKGGSSSDSKGGSSGDSKGGGSSDSGGGSSSPGGQSDLYGGKYDSIYASVTADDLKIPGKPNEFANLLTMEVTAYTHTGNRTSRGTYPQFTRTRSKPGSVAVAPATIPYGTLVYVEGYGYAIAEDTGGFAQKRPMQIDVFMNTRSECVRWGRRRNVNVYIIEAGHGR